MRTWTYPTELLDALREFGLNPAPTTSPLLVREALNDLYRYEIRRLRGRLLDGHMGKPDYVPAVIALRKKYWPLSLQPGAWERVCEGPVIGESTI